MFLSHILESLLLFNSIVSKSPASGHCHLSYQSLISHYYLRLLVSVISIWAYQALDFPSYLELPVSMLISIWATRLWFCIKYSSCRVFPGSFPFWAYPGLRTFSIRVFSAGGRVYRLIFHFEGYPGLLDLFPFTSFRSLPRGFTGGFKFPPFSEGLLNPGPFWHIFVRKFPKLFRQVCPRVS